MVRFLPRIRCSVKDHVEGVYNNQTHAAYQRKPVVPLRYLLYFQVIRIHNLIFIFIASLLSIFIYAEETGLQLFRPGGCFLGDLS